MRYRLTVPPRSRLEIATADLVTEDELVLAADPAAYTAAVEQPDADEAAVPATMVQSPAPPRRRLGSQENN